MEERGARADAAVRAGAGRLPGVLFLARDLKVGGAERVFLDYVSHARSVRPVVVLRRREGGLLADLPAAVPVYDLAGRADAATGPREGSAVPKVARTGLTPGSLLQLAQECLRLRRITEETGCRVVSSFLMRSHIVALLTKRWLAPDLRVVLNVHEHMSESEPHLYPTVPDRLAMRWVTRRLFPLADRIVVVADSLRTDLTETFGLSPDLITVVHNPIAVRSIRGLATEEAPDCETDGAALLVAVGRLVHLKGFDVLIRAVGRLVPGRDVHLLVIGDGPERSALERLIRELGLEGRVRLLGMRSNPWKYMSRACALVVPSRTEAFPNVIGEALALGVLVIAADCSAGIGEYLDGGRCGILVPPDDESALAAAIEWALDNPEPCRQLADAGRERVGLLELRNVVERYETALAGPEAV